MSSNICLTNHCNIKRAYFQHHVDVLEKIGFPRKTATILLQHYSNILDILKKLDTSLTVPSFDDQLFWDAVHPDGFHLHRMPTGCYVSLDGDLVVRRQWKPCCPDVFPVKE